MLAHEIQRKNYCLNDHCKKKKSLLIKKSFLKKNQKCFKKKKMHICVCVNDKIANCVAYKVKDTRKQICTEQQTFMYRINEISYCE
jgi:hypothetical protein